MKHSTVNLCLGIALFIGSVVSIIKQEPATDAPKDFSASQE